MPIKNPPGNGCHGDNEYFTLLDGSTMRTVNFYDTLGTIEDERWHNAHGDGNGDARTWAGYLTYKLYNDAFKGKLDEIKIYRSALNAAAISAAYASSIRSLELTFDEAPGQDIFQDSFGQSTTTAAVLTTGPAPTVASPVATTRPPALMAAWPTTMATMAWQTISRSKTPKRLASRMAALPCWRGSSPIRSAVWIPSSVLMQVPPTMAWV